MMPPILVYDSVPLMRMFCNVPGEMVRSFRTSFDLSHCLGSSFLPEMRSLRSSNKRVRNSFRSSRVITSIAIMNDFTLLWYKIEAFDLIKFPTSPEVGTIFSQNLLNTNKSKLYRRCFVIVKTPYAVYDLESVRKKALFSKNSDVSRVGSLDFFFLHPVV